MSESTQKLSTARGAIFNLIRRLHFYIGLFVAPFIFVAALTGTLYVLTPQIENFLYKDALTVTPVGNAQPLAAQIDAARRYIGENSRIYAVRPAPGATDSSRIQFSDSNLGPSESRSIFVDPYTLQIKGDMTVYGTSGVLPLRMWLDQLHSGLLLGDLGRNYSELAASWLWIAAVGGMILWLGSRAPRRVKKRPKGKFAVSRHWHLTLGVALLGGLLFFSATGLTWSQWAGSNIDKMRTSLNWLTPQVNTNLSGSALQSPPDPHAEHHAAGAMAGMDMSSGNNMPAMAMNGGSHSAAAATAVNQPNADWDNVLNAARAAGISAAKVELRQPKAADKAWTVTEIDRSWPTQVDAVSVNPTDFSIVDQVWFDQFPLIAKLTRWGIDAHMGVLFGLPNQLILAFFGLGLCTMIVLGYRMWWLRRPEAAQANPAHTLCASWLALNLQGKLLTLLAAVALGYCLPVMGLSLLLFMMADMMRWNRLAQRPRQTSQRPVTQRSPVSFIKARIAAKPKQARKMARCLLVLAVVIGTVIAKATISGVIEQYQIPFSQWTTLMMITQAFMILIYTTVFTALFTVPLWYFFLGEEDNA